MRFSLALLAALLFCLPVHAEDMPPKKLPNFSVTAIDGKTWTSADFKGKILILNFWAAWCGPCVIEFPALLQAAAKNPDNTILLALSSDLSEEAIRGFLKKMEEAGHKVALPGIVIALDRDDITHSLFGIDNLPETYVVGPDGTLQNHFIGAEWKPEDLQAAIDRLK